MIELAVTAIRPNPDQPRKDFPPESLLELGQSIKEMTRRVESLERWREQLVTKLEADKVEVINAGEHRASRLHEHIEKDRVEMERKIESLPERIIAILKNTGAI